MTFFIKKINLRTYISNTVYIAVLCFIFYLSKINIAYAVVGVLLAYYVNSLRKIVAHFSDIVFLFLLFLSISFMVGQPFSFSPYASPIIGFAILVTVLYSNLELSVILTLYFSLIAGVLFGNNFSTVIYSLSAGLVAIFLSHKSRKRWEIIEAGLIGGVVALSVSVLFNQQLPSFDLMTKFLINGFLSAIVVLGTLPIFEYLFKVVTNISLLELTDFNHPLLKKMMLEAPGTYQHSLVVANLAEAAAESIGANFLLARVGAYYHDIGKISKAEYFVENQIPYKDMHKNLTPSMSTLVILNHVKEGIDLARTYKLSPTVIDFISQHHGTTLVYYFYQRAKNQDNAANNEEQFRYPGPRPQSKETAIVSLADSVEAVSRTLEEPSPSRIRELVNETIKNKFIDGQLDETDLTLKDLENITESFSRILCAVFHTRIDYLKKEE